MKLNDRAKAQDLNFQPLLEKGIELTRIDLKSVKPFQKFPEKKFFNFSRFKKFLI